MPNILARSACKTSPNEGITAGHAEVSYPKHLTTLSLMAQYRLLQFLDPLSPPTVVMSKSFLGPEAQRRRQATACTTCRDRRVSIALLVFTAKLGLTFMNNRSAATGRNPCARDASEGVEAANIPTRLFRHMSLFHPAALGTVYPRPCRPRLGDLSSSSKLPSNRSWEQKMYRLGTLQRAKMRPGDQVSLKKHGCDRHGGKSLRMY